MNKNLRGQLYMGIGESATDSDLKVGTFRGALAA